MNRRQLFGKLAGLVALPFVAPATVNAEKLARLRSGVSMKLCRPDWRQYCIVEFSGEMKSRSITFFQRFDGSLGVLIGKQYARQVGRNRFEVSVPYSKEPDWVLARANESFDDIRYSFRIAHPPGGPLVMSGDEITQTFRGPIPCS